jgi:hypothetical protein
MPEGTIWLATSGQPTPGITIRRRTASLRTATKGHCSLEACAHAAQIPGRRVPNQRKAEGTIPMRVTAPPVFETGAVPLTALPSMG